MFELRIRIDNSKKTNFKIVNPKTEEIKERTSQIDSLSVNYYDNNSLKESLYETFIGSLQIMRVKSENISLTDKYEFFRFLPIKRGETVSINS